MHHNHDYSNCSLIRGLNSFTIKFNLIEDLAMKLFPLWWSTPLDANLWATQMESLDAYWQQQSRQEWLSTDSIPRKETLGIISWLPKHPKHLLKVQKLQNHNIWDPTCYKGSQIAKFMGPTWVLSAPDGPHVGQINLAIRVDTSHCPIA